jgi:hypothetical protein
LARDRVGRRCRQGLDAHEEKKDKRPEANKRSDTASRDFNVLNASRSIAKAWCTTAHRRGESILVRVISVTYLLSASNETWNLISMSNYAHIHWNERDPCPLLETPMRDREIDVKEAEQRTVLVLCAVT